MFWTVKKMIGIAIIIIIIIIIGMMMMLLIRLDESFYDVILI